MSPPDSQTSPHPQDPQGRNGPGDAATPGQPRIRAIHATVPGRTRYRIQELVHDPDLGRLLEQQLCSMDGVSQARANALTGTLLVRYNGGRDHDEMAAIVAGLLQELAGDPPPAAPPRQTALSDPADPPDPIDPIDTGPAPQPSLRRQAGEALERIHISLPELPNAPLAKLKELASGAWGRLGRVNLSQVAQRISPPRRAETEPEAAGPEPAGLAQPWHHREGGEILAELGVAADGLDDDEAARRLDALGPNELPQTEARSRWSILREQFMSLPVGLLAGAAGLSVITGGLLDGAIIMGVVVANALIGYTTESEAESTVNALKRFVRPQIQVLRGGRQIMVPASQVVPGDVLELTPGTYVAADARILSARHLCIDESALTGESMPACKTVDPLSDDGQGGHTPLGDISNMAFSGTLVTGGQGRAVAVATGLDSQIGQLQALLATSAPPEAPIKRQLATTGDHLVRLCLGVCGSIFGIGMLRGHTLMEMLNTSISLAAAAVPEGLPGAATTTFALGVRDMRRHHVLVRELQAVETLGAIQTLCFDKTGTITQNRMSVMRIQAGGRRLHVLDGLTVSGVSHRAWDELPEFHRLLEVCVLCNETRLKPESESPDDLEARLVGTPTEKALVRLAVGMSIDLSALRHAYPLLEIRHRSENRLFMASLHETPDGGALLAVKGSPPEVLEMCSTRLEGDQVLPLDDKQRAAIEIENERMAGDALRVLGVALRRGASPAELEAAADGTAGSTPASGPDGPESGPPQSPDLTWIGLVGMADPIRPGVAELIATLHDAGIDTVMITGDQSPTAYAVAKELGLSRDAPLEILDSTRLHGIDSKMMQALAGNAHVYSRVSPAHKLQIVQALQSAGRIVAMTGDGINDSPALKAADIGVAMGASGTDIAREVADVVLEQDDLATLVRAIEDGRTIHDNIRKSVHFFLATNLSEIAVMFVALASGMPTPLTAMQLLWINLISDIFPGLALSMEHPEPDVMDRPPRAADAPLFTWKDYKRMGVESAAISAGTVGAFAWGLLRYGAGPRASTLAFQTLTVSQLLHALSCRSERHSAFDRGKLPPNKYLTIALGGSLLAQFATFLPPLRRLLGLTPLGVLDALLVIGASLGSLALNEFTKTPRRRAAKPAQAPQPPAKPALPLITLTPATDGARHA